jgi:16S rRNA (guanine1516-N2)-methyltransferase
MTSRDPLAREALRLVRVDGRLELCAGGDSTGVCLHIDDLKRRIRQGRELALAKACGVRPALRVLDGMAGYGLDGLTLATLGCDVLMVERDPLLSALLGDAMQRARAEVDLTGTVACRVADVRDVLSEGSHFDAVYLDPMFPARRKRALPRKSAQVLRTFIGEADADLQTIVNDSIPLARRRVVVKRHRHDAPIGRPDWQILGRSVRFDVYRGTASAAG